MEMVELLGKGERARSAWKEMGGEGREREASCGHRAAGTEPKSPDLEPGREAPHLWVSDLQGVCSEVRFRTAYNKVINCCPSKN